MGIHSYNFEMKKLVIFGAGDIAELADHYFTTDSDYEFVAFTVDDDFRDIDEFNGKPLIPFSKMKVECPSTEFAVFVALSYSKMNAIRKAKYFEVKDQGYEIASYVSSYATVLNQREIGSNCFILEDNTIQPKVLIGNNVTLWSGNHIGHHSVIKDHSFISSHVVVSGGVTIEESVFIGVNATLRDHITIGERSLIGAGAIIMKSTEIDSVYVANATSSRDVKSTQIKSI